MFHKSYMSNTDTYLWMETPISRRGHTINRNPSLSESRTKVAFGDKSLALFVIPKISYIRYLLVWNSGIKSYTVDVK